MFMLVTGASGAGKTTARLAIQNQLAPLVESVELVDLVPIPAVPTIAWRQETVEVAVRRAVQLQEQGRHLLLSGDPVVMGELLAVPSAPELEAIASCLLDVQPVPQAERLARRGDPADLLVRHQAFAAWMRGHAADPRHIPEVITNDAWSKMRWERWESWFAGDPRWSCTVIDTSDRRRVGVAELVLAWCQDAIARRPGLPILTGEWWVDSQH
jgi:hypothetical protein